MKRSAALGLGTLALLLAGGLLFALDLSSRLSALERAGPGSPAAAAPSPAADLRARVAALEARVDELRGAVQALRDGLPARGAPLPAGAPAAPGAAPPGPGETPGAAPGADLEAAVAAVLEKRAREARRGEFVRRAERFVMRLDPQVKLTDVKREASVPILADYLMAREDLLRRPIPDEEERRAAVAALDADRDARLRGVLSEGELKELLHRLGEGRPGGGPRLLEDLPGGEGRRQGVDRMPRPGPPDPAPPPVPERGGD